MNGRSRPKAAPESIAADFPSIAPHADIAGLTPEQSRRFETWLAASYAAGVSLDVPRWTDAELAYCAEMHREFEARALMSALAEAGYTAAGLSRELLRFPTYAELAERRKPPTEPCSLRSCRGVCSRCVRAAAVARNRRRFGCDDHPGRATLPGVTR